MDLEASRQLHMGECKAEENGVDGTEGGERPG